MRNLKLAVRSGFSSIFVLIGMLLVAVALPVATRLVQQNQENRSSAASSTIIQDSKCKNAGGTCQKTSSNCSGSYKSSYCPSSDSSVKCCVKSSSSSSSGSSSSTIIQDSKCKNAGGTCQKTSSNCSGSYKSSYCPSSDSSVKCCVKSSSSSSSGSTITQDSKCTSAGGSCVNVSSGCSGGNFLSGYCPSSDSSVKCCVKNTASSCSSKGGSCVGSSSTCTSTMGGVVLSASGDCSSTVPVCCKVGGKPTATPTIAHGGASGTFGDTTCSSNNGTCLSYSGTIKTGDTCSGGKYNLGYPCQTGKACCVSSSSSSGCSSLTQANCEKNSNCFLGDKTGTNACETKRSNGSECKYDKWCVSGYCSGASITAWSYASGKCATRTATPTPTGTSNVGASCYSTDGSYQAFDESKCKGNTYCDRTTGKCVANTTSGSCNYSGTTINSGSAKCVTDHSSVSCSNGVYTVKSCGNGGCDNGYCGCYDSTTKSSYSNGYKICRDSGILTCLNGTWSTPGTCKYGCRTSTTCAVCKEGVAGTSGGCESGHTCYQGACINSGDSGTTTNSTACKNRGGVCATFTTALSNNASCKTGTITGVVVTGLCKGDSKTVCCVAQATGINYTPVPTKAPSSGGSSGGNDDSNDDTSSPTSTPAPTSTVTPTPTGTIAPTSTLAPTGTIAPTSTSGVPKISFKFSLRGVKPSYNDKNGKAYDCFSKLGNLVVDVVNSPTNIYQTGLSTSFAPISSEVNINGDQVFKVTSLALDSKFSSVNNFNYVKLKGPFHVKRRMCLDGQSAKVSETTVCNISLISNTVYDFSDYTLLAGDIDKNGVVNSVDYSIVKRNFNADADIVCGREGDLNMDGVVNWIDGNLISKEALSSRDDE
jgi:hypothetical protein